MDTLRPVTPDDAAICGRICYDAFCTINDEHRFPHDFPSVEVATGLLCMMIDHPGFYGVVAERDGSARTVAAGGGVTFHHIALNCSDIFDTVARMRSNGVHFVPISENYYDDLLTRVDLDQDLLTRMRSAGVLFDRSQAGDYFHIYTESIDDGLFFEVVQRVNAYDGYGATNAPARMASQAQGTA